jgi:hypothetical protein
MPLFLSFFSMANSNESSATTSAHTRGPWHVYQSPRNEFLIQSHAGQFLASTATGYGPRDCANARLIAAAPDLLGHLETIVEMAHSVSDNWESGDLAYAVRSLNCVTTEAEAAIAAARGEAA